MRQRRLNERRRAWPHVSASALGAILQSCREHGVPDGNVGRNELRAARDNEITEVTEYGPIGSSMPVIDTDGNQMDIPIAHPIASLYKAVTSCAPFAAFLDSRLQELPPTVDQPWSLVLYTDGVTPGDPLQGMNRRKFQVCYWSFLEMGTNALSREETWFTLFTVFETVIKKVQAGLSQLFTASIKAFFDTSGFDLSTAGITLPLPSGDVRFFCKLRVVLQDGGAHKVVWHSRGDGATRPCLLCANLVTPDSGLIERDATGRLRSDILKYSELVKATGRDIRNSARYIAAQAHLLHA